MGDSGLNILLISIIWVIVGVETDNSIGAAVPIPVATAIALYTISQCLQASFTKAIIMHPLY